MTRKSKREIEREVSNLSDRENADGWGSIACEHDDGAVTDPDGEPLPEDADPVLTVSRDVARTWP